ncbi:DUF4130 domain-containing protein [Myxococcus sp. AB025B]|uniref:DUF4130 domain-containing protein n=1 Tax=Myxococcus sp. AB025B TaxID=2562794 RepID=UPI001E3524B0|nr:DUF4130 domain-containing protein [Myxococcus sp. AB025B]
MRVSVAPELSSFREVARGLLVRGMPPDRVEFEQGQEAWTQWVDPLLSGGGARSVPALPADFLSLAEKVVCHRDAERFALLYRVLWRLTHGERRLLEKDADRDVQRLRRMERAVRRDLRELVIRVRFHRAASDGEARHVAWYRPEHLVVRLAAPFLVGRFPSLHWSLFTPDASAHWDRARLSFGAGHAFTEPGPSPATAVSPDPGPSRPRVLLLGDVPGTREEGDAACFVGPSGRLLELVLSRAGLRTSDLRVSRARWPGRRSGALNWPETRALREELASEAARVRPRLLLALGGAAGQVLLGPGFRLDVGRGRLVPSEWAPGALATFAPWDVLRRQDPRERAEARIHFEADVRAAAQWLKSPEALGS